MTRQQQAFRLWSCVNKNLFVDLDLLFLFFTWELARLLKFLLVIKLCLYLLLSFYSALLQQYFKCWGHRHFLKFQQQPFLLRHRLLLNIICYCCSQLFLLELLTVRVDLHPPVLVLISKLVVLINFNKEKIQKLLPSQ